MTESTTAAAPAGKPRPAPATAPAPAALEGRIGRGRRFLSAPAIVYLIIVTQVPFAMTIYLSFTNWNLLRPASAGFLGVENMFRNYSRILQNPDFYAVVGNTVVLTTSVVIVTFVLGMAFALLLNRPFPGRAIARTLMISPFLVMPVASAIVWKNLLLEPSYGLSAWAFRSLGLPSVYLVEIAPLVSIIVVAAWQWTPFVMLILLAGLQSMPDEVIEAAYLDGAGPAAMFRFITLPHLRRFIEIALLLEIIFVLNIFGKIFVITSGGPGLQTTNLPYQIFLEAFSRWNVGRASAYGIFAIILANIVILLFLQVVRRKRQEEGR
jgi:sorbitol/mannitol transport system permease protein